MLSSWEEFETKLPVNKFFFKPELEFWFMFFTVWFFLSAIKGINIGNGKYKYIIYGDNNILYICL